MNITTCPLCKATGVAVSFPEARDYITGEIFQVLQCRACTVGFTSPPPENLEKYYPAQYRRYNPLVLWVLKKLYHTQVNRWTRQFGRSGSALEVGCGDGMMLDALRKKGWSVAGTERTEAMAEFARKNLGLEVYTGGMDAIPAGKKFDLIIMFQVLEHIGEPMTMLNQCRDRLTENGELIIAIPNLDSWQSRYSAASWLHLDVPRHLFHYSPASLRTALDLAGLSVSRIGFVSFEHDPYGWVQSILNKQFGNSNGLTRLLMRLDGMTLNGILAILIGGILVLPSLLLALLSWPFGKGAIMQVVSSHKKS